MIVNQRCQDTRCMYIFLTMLDLAGDLIYTMPTCMQVDLHILRGMHDINYCIILHGIPWTCTRCSSQVSRVVAGALSDMEAASVGGSKLSCSVCVQGNTRLRYF
jgi:hypothetical protein